MSSNELMCMNWQKMIKPEKVQVTSNPLTASLFVNLLKGDLA